MASIQAKYDLDRKVEMNPKTFLNEFENAYQRNNKSTGQKNIRCFPSCCAEGHTVKGFCGQSLRIKLPHFVKDLAEPLVLRCWGEFTLSSDKDRNNLTLRDAYNLERGLKNPLRPWIRGQPAFNDEIGFNKDLLGWHYQWQSSKHDSHRLHVFRIYLFALNQVTGELLLLCAPLRSPEFQLYSRRKREQFQKERELRMSQKSMQGGEGRSRLGSGSSDGESVPDANQVIFHNTKRRRVTHDSQEKKHRDATNLVADRLLRFALLIDSNYKAEEEVDFGDHQFQADLDLLISQTLDLEPEFGQEEKASFGYEVNPPSTMIEMQQQQQQQPPQQFPERREVDLISMLLDLLQHTGWEASSVKRLETYLRALPGMLLSVAVNRPDFKSFLDKWQTNDGIMVLEKISKVVENEQLKIDDFTTPQEETFRFTYNNKEYGSFYCELRQLFIKIMREALAQIDPSLTMRWFEHPMEIAARYDLFNVDPHYPPTRRVAAMCHFQLYGGLHHFAEHDFGSRQRCFMSPEDRDQWRTAYWRIQRKSFQGLLIKHLMGKMRMQCPLNLPPPLNNQGVSGKWIKTDSNTKNLIDVAHVIGISMGELCASLYDALDETLFINLSDKGIHLTGNRVLFAHPDVWYPFSDQPRKYYMANPLPFRAWDDRRTGIAWGNSSYAYVCSGGNTRAAYIDQFANTPDSAKHEHITDIQEGLANPHANAEFRFLKHIALHPHDTNILLVTHTVFLFSRGQAPPITHSKDLVNYPISAPNVFTRELVYHRA